MPARLEYNLTNVKIFEGPFDYVFNEPHGYPVGRWMERRGKAALAYSKGRVGVRTGALKAAISMQHDRGAAMRQQRVRIGTFEGGPRGYSVLHHRGTAPHIIKSKRGRELVFVVGGRRVRAKMVRHPGTKPNHYLTDTFKIFVG